MLHCLCRSAVDEDEEDDDADGLFSRRGLIGPDEYHDGGDSPAGPAAAQLAWLASLGLARSPRFRLSSARNKGEDDFFDNQDEELQTGVGSGNEVRASGSTSWFICLER